MGGRPASGKGRVSSSRMWCKLEERPGEGVLGSAREREREREKGEVYSCIATCIFSIKGCTPFNFCKQLHVHVA